MTAHMRVVIVHRWDGHPAADWYPWLRKELEKRGHEVIAPTMPESGAPNVDAWVKTLHEAVGKADPNTVFVGHSIGAQTILRHLAKHRSKARGALFVAGWFTASGLSEEEQRIADQWLTAPVNVVAARKSLPKVTALFSQDDPYVPHENHEFFEKNLSAKVIVLEGKGHFTAEDGIKKEQTILRELLSLLE